MSEHRSSIEIVATPEAIFDYLITDVGITSWMGEWARVNPVVGGEFSVNIVGYGARGEFLEIRRPERVSVSWGFEGSDSLPPGASTVTFELTPLPGRTRVDVVHAGLPERDIPGHASGWKHFLSRLHIAASGGKNPRDTWDPNTVTGEGQS